MSEQNWITMQFGEKWYRICFNGEDFERERLRIQCLQHFNHALLSFHSDVLTMAEEQARIKGLLLTALDRLGNGGHDLYMELVEGGRK